MTQRRLFSGFLATLLLSIGVAGAAPENPTKLLYQIPQPAFDGAFYSGSPMKDGLNGDNRSGWIDVGQQYPAMIPIAYGAILGKASVVDKYFTVIDVSFQHQLPDGSFAFAPFVNGKPNDPRGEPTAEGFFIGASTWSLLLLRSSSLGPRYAARIDALVPKYKANLRWLSAPEQVQKMFDVDSSATNRLLADAEALLIGDRFAGFPEARPAGERLLAAALAQQAPGGYFLESGGTDTSYNAVSCGHLAEMALFLDDPRIMSALKRCEAWEYSRIEPNGHVSEAGNTRTGAGHMTALGTPYTVAYPHVIRMFATYAVLTGDKSAMDAANSIAAYHNAQKKAH